MERRRVLVAGATGYLGGEVVKAMHRAGYWVRALARDERRLAVREACDDVFVGEATRPATLIGAMDGVDVVFSSIGVRSLARRPTIWDVDCQANLNLVELAERSGVRDFAFSSVFRGDELRSEMAVGDARERVVDALRASSMRRTVIRPNGFFNDMADYFAMARKGRVWLIGDGSARFNPIHGADIADVVVEELARDTPAGIERAVGGPDVFSFREVGKLAFDALGQRPRFGSVPEWLLRPAAALARPFNQNAAAFISMFGALSTGAVAPSVGTHHLADFFAELAAQPA